MCGVRRFVRRSAGCFGLILLVGVLNATAQQVASPPQAPAPRVAGTTAAAPAEAGQLAVLGKEAYLMPPKEIADAILAARNEIVTLTNLSPDGRKFLIARQIGRASCRERV